MKYSDIIDGIQVLMDHEGDEHGLDVGHDVIKAGHTDPSELNGKELTTLERAGWHWDTSEECWYAFT